MNTFVQLLVVPVLYVVSRAPEVASALVGVSLVLLLSQPGMPIVSGLMTLAIALLGALAVGLACTLPTLPDRDVTTSRRHTSQTEQKQEPR